MSTSNICYFNGDLVPYDDLHIHVADLQIQRGYGIFDFFRSRKGSIPWLEDYMDRLFTSLELSGIEADLNRAQLFSIVQELQERNDLPNGAFKVLLTGGYSDNLESQTGKANLIILNRPWHGPGEKSHRQGVNLIRDHFIRPNPEIKTLYYFNSLRQQKKLRDYDAVDVLYHSETISETSRANLFFVRGDEVITPASHILKGITRKRVLTLYPEIRVEDIETGQLYDFDEIFISSTSRDITPVVSVEGQQIGKGIPGPVTREIQAALLKL